MSFLWFLHFYFRRSEGFLHGIWCQRGQAVNSGDPVSIPESNVICFLFLLNVPQFPTSHFFHSDTLKSLRVIDHY